jgi:hypothetical protein
LDKNNLGGKQTVQIIVSFKKEEEWLYKIICKHSGKSTFIKDILQKYYNDDNGNIANEVKASHKTMLERGSMFDLLENIGG